MKFEMSRYTLDMLKNDLGVRHFLENHSLVERKYTLFDYPVVINTDIPGGVVKYGRRSVRLTTVDHIAESLVSLIRTEETRRKDEPSMLELQTHIHEQNVEKG